MEELRIERVNCNLCLQETRHEVVAERSHSEPEYDYEGNPIFDVVTTYTMLECRGCGSVTLRKTEEATGPEIYREYFYPPSIARRQPVWIKDLPENFQTLTCNSPQLAAGSPYVLSSERERANSG